MDNTRTMESFIGTRNAKRYVIEDSITKVTSDGEPHEMMTMIAGLSGVLAAIIILTVLVSLVSCKKKRVNNGNQLNVESLGKFDESKRSSTSTIYTRAPSVAEDTDDAHSTDATRQAAVAIISSGNLEGNLNSAFMSSELCLSGSLQKKKKKTHWSDEIESLPQETSIEIERF